MTVFWSLKRWKWKSIWNIQVKSSCWGLEFSGKRWSSAWFCHDNGYVGICLSKAIFGGPSTKSPHKVTISNDHLNSIGEDWQLLDHTELYWPIEYRVFRYFVVILTHFCSGTENLRRLRDMVLGIFLIILSISSLTLDYFRLFLSI